MVTLRWLEEIPPPLVICDSKMRLQCHYHQPDGRARPQPWWEKFRTDTFGLTHHFYIDSIAPQYYVVRLRERLQDYNGYLIETHFGEVLEFDDEQDATFFLLTWG